MIVFSWQAIPVNPFHSTSRPLEQIPRKSREIPDHDFCPRTADVKSTEVYVRSDLAMKREALDRVGTPIRVGPKPRRLSKDLLDWLDSL